MGSIGATTILTRRGDSKAQCLKIQYHFRLPPPPLLLLKQSEQKIPLQRRLSQSRHLKNLRRFMQFGQFFVRSSHLSEL